MDTRTFLEFVLPSNGVKYVAQYRRKLDHPKGGVFLHKAFQDLDLMSDAILDLDRSTNDNVYFAMASYKEVRFKTVTRHDKEFTFVVGRTQDNASRVKCLWQDWDVGKANDAASYATREEALAGLKTYLAATRLPIPLIVSSGYGLHTYWVFSEDVAVAEWESIARYQRVIMRHLGVKFDPSRDRDCASVLRPVGTRNKKPGSEPRMVKTIREPGDILPAAEYKRLLRGYVEAHGLTETLGVELPSFLKGGGNLLGVPVEYPPSHAANVVKFCAQLREFSITGGSSEPLWYANLGVLKHCVDGAEKAHEWSAKHAEYDEALTQQKFDQWSAGPTTCERFREINPEGCDKCPHTCKSPVQLGITDELPKPDRVAVEQDQSSVADSPEPVEERDDGLPPCWPERYGYDRATECITTVMLNAKGVPELVRVATPLFYPVQMMFTEDGTFAFRMHMHVRGRVREFVMPTKAISDARSLKGYLASNQVYVMNDKAAVQYVSEYMTELRRRQEEISTYRQFGWHHDYKAFLIGDTLITATETRTVLLGTQLRGELAASFGTSGTVEEWRQGVNTLYNREHAEPHQLAICSAFGAILNPLLGSSMWNGIPYALTSDDSGYGKSTVCLIALSIYAHQSKEIVISDATAKAIPARASAMNNVPFLLDEITKYLTKPADMSDTLYAMSNGRTRIGLAQNGVERSRLPGWNTSVLITGNRNVMHHLSEHKLNPEATQMRVFEVDLQEYPRITTMIKGHADCKKYGAQHAALATHLIDNCYGEVGLQWIRFVMTNPTAVRDKLREVLGHLSKHMRDVDGDASKERFYYQWAACTLVGGYFAKKLGFIDFDLNNLRRWIVAHVAKLRQNVVEMKNTPQDHFASFMADVADKLLITKKFQKLDSRNDDKVEPLLNDRPLRNPICGRLVIGDEKERPKLYVTVQSVRDWCADKGIQYSRLRREWMDEGLLRLGTPGTNRATGGTRVRIGRGILGYQQLGSPWCLELDYFAAAGTISTPESTETQVVTLRAENASA